MTKHKVLHISHTDIRFDSRILKEISVLELSSQHEVLAMGIVDNESLGYTSNHNKSMIKSFHLLSKKLKFLPRPIRYFFNYLEAMLKLIIPGVKFNPSVVHCHDTLFLPIAVIIKLVTGSKLIYDAHELESDKNGQTKILSKVTLIIEKISWSKIDLLISVGPSIIEWYNNNFKKKKSLMILNSPTLSSENFGAQLNRNYLREKFNIPISEKIFIYLGIIGPGRGIDLYLDVFKNDCLNSHVVFIGYGAFTDKIKKASDEYPNIHFHPSVPHDKIVEISRSADVGLCLVEAVSLSDYYCLPNKLFEYAFSGLFVLASDFPDIKEVVEDYNLGIYCTPDKESLKSTILKIEGIELHGSNADISPLSWQHQAEKLLKAYEELLKNSN